ncbi:MAG: PIN domain nuclease [Anaerolineales bacterium]
MVTPILIDTNILVYACDAAEAERQERAIWILQQVSLTRVGRLSAQVLAEFVNVTVKGKNPLLTHTEALLQATRLAQTYPVYDVTHSIVLEAARACRDFSLAYYDAQLWACAKLNDVPLIFSEDFSDGQILEGVRFVNPFAETFELEKWL